MKKTQKKMSKTDLDQALVDNFIALQKVLTHLSVKFDDLTTKMDRLMNTFEVAAKSFEEKYAEGTEKPADVDSEFLKKLDSLLDQNKLIAKGIMMMEDKIKNKQQFPAYAPQRQEDSFRVQNTQRY